MVPLVCHNLSLGQNKGLQRCEPRRKPVNHMSCSQECKKVWGNEPSNSQVNSHLGSWSPKWTPKFSESDYKGQNLMDWSVLYIIRKILERKCLKWACMTHFNIWNISYGQKKGRESNWQFDSRPLKVTKRCDFFMCRWRATYRWKAFNKGYNFGLDLISISGLHAKLWAPKVARVPTLGISGFPFGSLRTKCHLDVGLVERHRVYYKGEGGGFPQVWAVVSLVSLNLPMARFRTKMFKLCINQLIVWFVQIRVSN
jgi:hypothetical protein